MRIPTMVKTSSLVGFWFGGERWAGPIDFPTHLTGAKPAAPARRKFLGEKDVLVHGVGTAQLGALRVLL